MSVLAIEIVYYWNFVVFIFTFVIWRQKGNIKFLLLQPFQLSNGLERSGGQVVASLTSRPSSLPSGAPKFDIPCNLFTPLTFRLVCRPELGSSIGFEEG